MKRQIIIIPRLAVAILIAAFLATLGGCRQQPAKPQSREPFRVGVSENINSLDPLRITDVGAAFVASAIHSPISVVDQAGNVQPILAEKIEMAKDALSCRIELRRDLKFWNGDPVTAEDLAYSIERFRKTPHPAQWLVGRIAAAGLKVEDSQTLTIHFAEPEPDWPLFVSTQFLSVVKRGTAELPPTALNAEVIGCGAYRPERLAAGDAYEFERNAGTRRGSLGRASNSKSSKSNRSDRARRSRCNPSARTSAGRSCRAWRQRRSAAVATVLRASETPTRIRP